jgi:hypothetical protein
MRRTVDLIPVLDERVAEVAAERDASLSSTLAMLVSLGLESLGKPPRVVIDPVSGFPMVTSERAFTAAQVRELLEEDE